MNQPEQSFEIIEQSISINNGEDGIIFDPASMRENLANLKIGDDLIERAMPIIIKKIESFSTEVIKGLPNIHVGSCDLISAIKGEFPNNENLANLGINKPTLDKALEMSCRKEN